MTPHQAPDPEHDPGVVRIEAAVLLRGDLPDLLPTGADATRVDTALQAALSNPDPATAAAQISAVLDRYPDLAARLHSLERGLNTGQIGWSPTTRTRGGWVPPPGLARPVPPVVWTCPKREPRAGHYRKIQRIPHQDMGACPQHHVPLVREDPNP